MHVGSMSLTADVPVYTNIHEWDARKTTVLLLLNSLYTMFDLQVSCLGGPVIDG